MAGDGHPDITPGENTTGPASQDSMTLELQRTMPLALFIVRFEGQLGRQFVPDIEDLRLRRKTSEAFEALNLQMTHRRPRNLATFACGPLKRLTLSGIAGRAGGATEGAQERLKGRLKKARGGGGGTWGLTRLLGAAIRLATRAMTGIDWFQVTRLEPYTWPGTFVFGD